MYDIKWKSKYFRFCTYIVNIVIFNFLHNLPNIIQIGIVMDIIKQERKIYHVCIITSFHNNNNYYMYTVQCIIYVLK